MFLVPEQFRVQSKASFQTKEGDLFGYFLVPRQGRILLCVADDGKNAELPVAYQNWEHVSVSVNKRGSALKPKLPTWEEMCFVKSLFWGPQDTVVQFHPPESEYVDLHDVLHLWRSIHKEFPMPPISLV